VQECDPQYDEPSSALVQLGSHVNLICATPFKIVLECPALNKPDSHQVFFIATVLFLSLKIHNLNKEVVALL
jgi:hypothetical protein